MEEKVKRTTDIDGFHAIGVLYIDRQIIPLFPHMKISNE